MRSGLAVATQPRLSDDQLGELLALVDDADSVELKLTVPEADQRSAVEALGMDPLDAQIRQVFFFDTPDLALYKKGVVARARRVQKKGDDSVVKLRPVVPSRASDDLRQSPNMVRRGRRDARRFRVLGVHEAHPRHHRRASGRQGRAQAAQAVLEGAARVLRRARARRESSSTTSEILGPINVLKLKFAPAGYDRRMVAELWMYPDYTRILELSTKCAPGEAFDVAARARAFLAEQGVDVTGEQQTKTRTALEFFAREMRAKKPRARKPRARKPPAPKAPAESSQNGPAAKPAQADTSDEQPS